MFEIPAAPDVPVVGEQPAIIEPPLRDMPGFRGIDVTEAEPVDVEIANDLLWQELAARVRDVALADPRVIEAFSSRRHSVIGASRLDGKRTRQDTLLLVAYCYDDGQAYEVTIVDDGGELTVRDVAGLDYQPPPSDEELEAAIRLARGHPRVADRIQPEFEAHVLLAGSVEPGDEHHGRRRCSVVFGHPDERLPRVHALVDLGTEELLWVHTNETGPS